VPRVLHQRPPIEQPINSIFVETVDVKHTRERGGDHRDREVQHEQCKHQNCETPVPKLQVGISSLKKSVFLLLACYLVNIYLSIPAYRVEMSVVCCVCGDEMSVCMCMCVWL